MTPPWPPAPSDPGRRARIAWCFYDWANSAFASVILTFVFAAYFTRGVAATTVEGTAGWGFAITVSAIAIAVASPLLGAVADAGGARKPWLAGFTGLCVAATAALWWVAPDPSCALLALVLVAIANIAFELAVVFYNAMLPEVAPAGRIGLLSGWGWGFGYAGGLACLVLVLVVFVEADPPPFGLSAAAAEQVRIVGPVAALWYAIFAVPLFLFVPDRPRAGVPFGPALRDGLRRIGRTLRRLGQYRDILRFLVAHMIYTDGLNTLFAFGGIYAAGSFGMPVDEVILFGIAMNLAAGAGAAGFAWIDDRIGPRRTILVALAGLIVFGAAVLLVQSKAAFWGLGLTLGAFIGPAQAASRTLMARIAPDELRTEMFGLYALSGKATAFIGPAALGWAVVLTQSQRIGMATVLVFFVAGGLLMLAVKDPG